MFLFYSFGRLFGASLFFNILLLFTYQKKKLSSSTSLNISPKPNKTGKERLKEAFLHHLSFQNFNCYRFLTTKENLEPTKWHPLLIDFHIPTSTVSHTTLDLLPPFFLPVLSPCYIIPKGIPFNCKPSTHFFYAWFR